MRAYRPVGPPPIPRLSRGSVLSSSESCLDRKRYEFSPRHRLKTWLQKKKKQFLTFFDLNVRAFPFFLSTLLLPFRRHSLRHSRLGSAMASLTQKLRLLRSSSSAAAAVVLASSASSASSSPWCVRAFSSSLVSAPYSSAGEWATHGARSSLQANLSLLFCASVSTCAAAGARFPR